MAYINYRIQTAESGWERREFVRNWWQIYRGDPSWTPPHFKRLLHALDARRNPHLARLDPRLAYVEALPARGRRVSTPHGPDPFMPQPVAMTLEVPLAGVVMLRDPRRRDKTAYLALYAGANDVEATERLLYYAVEQLAAEGCRRMLGPVGLSPYAAAGALEDCWDAPPALHAPYNPPYLPELLGRKLRARVDSRLWHLEVGAPPPATGPATLTPLAPARLAGDLLPLLQAATENRAGFAPPDAEEAAFLLRWLGPNLGGWVAQVNERPVGFVLLQADTAVSVRRANGGRRWPWRLWLAARERRPVARGRLLFGATLPDWRGQGIGGQLWAQALRSAQAAGWRQLAIGPAALGSAAAAFLEKRGAQPRQSYALYDWSF